MKVLYIGNYRDGTGWGNACANNILALDSVGVNVVPRAITFNGSKQTQSQRIAELEEQSEAGADVCIQHTLPNLYSYNAKNSQRRLSGLNQTKRSHQYLLFHS